jgi:adenosylmethionine-8-amino-7-oxononanoate aminotransferase
LFLEIIHIPVPVNGYSNEQWKYIESVFDSNVAAFIYEPLLQGAAGMVMYDCASLEKLISLAKSKEIITIADEVLTGFGRTGKWFASDYLKQKSDIICLSKGITGGMFPLGVTLMNQKIVDLNNILRIEQKHLSFKEIFKNRNVSNLRVIGTVLALNFNSEMNSYTHDIRNKMYTYFIKKGLLMRPLGNVCYVIPPYCISNEQLEEIYKAIIEFTNELN